MAYLILSIIFIIIYIALRKLYKYLDTSPQRPEQQLTARNSNGIVSSPRKIKPQSGAASLFPSEFIVVDLETTGLSCYSDEIIEIGAIKVVPGNFEHEYMQGIVLADKPIPSNIVKLTGITQNMVNDGIDLKTAITELKSFIGTLPIVAFNASFDMGFLQVAAKRYGFTFNNKVFCALELSRLAFPGLKSYKLDYLSKKGGIKSSQSHRALDDCKRTIVVFNGAISVLKEQKHKLETFAKVPVKPIHESNNPNNLGKSSPLINYIQSLDESVFNINKGTCHKLYEIEDVIHEKDIELGFYLPESKRFHYLNINSKTAKPLPQANFIPTFSKLKKKHSTLFGKVLNVDVVPKFVKSREVLTDIQLKFSGELLSKVVFDDIEHAASACFGIEEDELISLTEDGYPVKEAIKECSISMTVVIDYQGVVYPVIYAIELDILLEADEMVTPKEILITCNKYNSEVQHKIEPIIKKTQRFMPLSNFDAITNKLFTAISDGNWGGVNAAISLKASLIKTDNSGRNALAYAEAIGDQSIISLIRKYT